ncbi:hypothetical protein M3J07_013861 [Ascochyta lentis]
MAPRMYRSRSAPSEIPSDGSSTRRRLNTAEKGSTNEINQHHSTIPRLQLQDQATTEDQPDGPPTANSDARRTMNGDKMGLGIPSRRYSYPGSSYDLKRGGLTRTRKGGLEPSAWRTVKGCLRRVTGAVGARINKAVRLTTRTRGKAAAKVLLYSLCGVAVGVLAGVYTYKGLDSMVSKSWDIIVELEKFDYPEASGWRAFPYWMHTHDPYAALDLARPLVPEWGPPPIPAIKQGLRRARKAWHPDHWRQFKANENISDRTAHERATYAWKVLDQSGLFLTNFWKDPYCKTKMKPLLPNITAEMTELGLPFMNTTCPPCTYGDALKKLGKAFLRGPEAVLEPLGAYCPCPIKKKLEHLEYNLYHLSPAGHRRYYPAHAHYDTGFLRKLRAPSCPEAWWGDGLKNATLLWLWEVVNQPKFGEIVWSDEEREKYNKAGWIVADDLVRFGSCDDGLRW